LSSGCVPTAESTGAQSSRVVPIWYSLRVALHRHGIETLLFRTSSTRLDGIFTAAQKSATESCISSTGHGRRGWAVTIHYFGVSSLHYEGIYCPARAAQRMRHMILGGYVFLCYE
jgi:hypothetical protein